MKVCAFSLKPHLHFPRHIKLINTSSFPKHPPIQTLPRSTTPSPSSIKICNIPNLGTTPNTPKPPKKLLDSSSDVIPKWVILGSASIGLALFLLGIDGQEALAWGPEGPLVEEFWDNMRRYGLYIVTVSTGVIYTIFQPILELLKNPISAILIVTVLVGSAYLMSQVLSAMVGISEFSYDYGY